MLRTFKERREQEEGFTLIELMVVVLIIAILLAIAIPTFLGARDRANDRAAQSSLRNALTAAKTIFTDAQDYTSADTSAELSVVEPSLTYTTAASTDFKIVSLASSGAATWAAAALSKSGTCYLIKDLSGAGGGTKYGTHATCTGAQALTSAIDDKW
ncbi:MAG TPA: prepilin-type N-terminal cleavage/methylation domain-containing protein [Acidimicrobiales bacterium]|nr:prepilin-type N-terminal cleavage/methylation domain-containing protein [Acidimicrobiales bacterium]